MSQFMRQSMFLSYLCKVECADCENASRACLKNHSRNLHAPLCGIFHPNSVAVARYGALIRAKSPTNCDVHLAESLFQTRSRTGYRECYVSPVKILQNIRGNMIYLFRDYIEIPLVGLLHTTGRRFLICKNIKNGNKFCLFLQQ